LAPHDSGRAANNHWRRGSLEGFCRKFCDTSDDMSAIAVEQLVYGLNLEEDLIQKPYIVEYRVVLSVISELR